MTQTPFAKLGEKLDQVLSKTSGNLTKAASDFKEKLESLKDQSIELDKYDFVEKATVYLSFKQSNNSVEVVYSLEPTEKSLPVETYVDSQIYDHALKQNEA